MSFRARRCALPRNDNSGSTGGLIAAVPVDDVVQWFAFEIGAQILAEEIDPAMALVVAGARDVWRDQHPRIGPQPRRRQMPEFPDLDIERDAAQTALIQ